MKRRAKMQAGIVIILCLCELLSVVDGAGIFEMRGHSEKQLTSSVTGVSFSGVHRSRRDVSADPNCVKQQNDYLKTLDQQNTQNGTRIEHLHTFQNESNFNLALAWAGVDDDGVLIVVTSEYYVITAKSNVWRSPDYGRTWDLINNKMNNEVIRRDQGLQRNPHDAKKVYLVTYVNNMWVTEDGGKNFYKRAVVDNNQHLQGDLVFHTDSDLSTYMLAISLRSEESKLYMTNDNWKTKKLLASHVSTAKWGTKESKSAFSVFALFEPDDHVSYSYMHARVYTLKSYATDSCSDGGDCWKALLQRVAAFGIQGKFMYASVFKTDHPTTTDDRVMMVSTDAGHTWYKALLPTLADDRFYSVLDMSEDLIFMHVDNPGDTGHGTLYMSGNTGVVYSESLERHLYPNFGSVTDFYKVESMRGVYLASQINEDKSIHTMITYDRGGKWQQISKPEGASCQDTSKDCYLQIHNFYSMSRGVKAKPPLSVAGATGIVLAHGHIAATLQTTNPDVYLTTDGGYTWRKVLDGPHSYQIADSGGLLVAVDASTASPNTLKFSTDEGHCWHEYKFINDSIHFTGLLTEPGSRSLTVSVWGYDSNKKWKVFVINFADIIPRRCVDSDYESWTAHSSLRSGENKGVEGCLLGRKETFRKLKKDSWCRNGYDFVADKTEVRCTCTREDYECDYSFYRPDGSDNCVKQPSFNEKEVDICLQGHEEEVITEGYRKIPGDVCKDGFAPSGRLINLHKQCAGNRANVISLEKSQPSNDTTKGQQHNLLLGIIIICIIILVLGTTIFFGYKFYLLRKHKVVYRYSLLNQNDALDYDAEFERALTQPDALFVDTEDEEEVKPVDKRAAGKSTANGVSSSQPNGRARPFHDDSDDDLLE